MRFKLEDFRAREGKHVRLHQWPTKIEPVYKSAKDYEKLLAEHVAKMSEYQNLHYASKKTAILLIFQGMDGAGKDGTIRHVMSGINPQGCQVFNFKHPSEAELEHDFLWRTTRNLPERGRIGIFNRSYYEEVLITRVHPSVLEAEGISSSLHHGRKKQKLWQERYESINNLERHLHRNGTQILKFFLHLSQKEQRKRFLDRIDDPKKNWKLSTADIKERAFWNKYTSAYQECITATSSEHAPWYVIPADDKANARLLVSHILLNAFSRLKMHYPKTDARRLIELRSIRKRLEAD